MTSAFDAFASRYDELWTNSGIGRLQRDAVWRLAGEFFRPGDSVLDLGCGTGEDAAWLSNRGISVIATDSSPAMVRMARLRGADARIMPIEEHGGFTQQFDGILSNFGALNCVQTLPDLASLIRPGGYLVVCFIGRFCLWETVWYALHGQFRKASRRWGGAASSSFGVEVFYPRMAEIRAAFAPAFIPVLTAGIGVCVPPSYVRGLSSGVLAWLAKIDSIIAAWPGMGALSDHRLLVFRRA